MTAAVPVIEALPGLRRVRLVRRCGAAGKQAVVERPDGRLGPVADIDLPQQALHVDLDRRFGDAQPVIKRKLLSSICKCVLYSASKNAPMFL